MLDAAEQLDEMQQLDERNIHANRLLDSLRTAQGDFPDKHFHPALLYFVACLIANGKSDAGKQEERVLVRPRSIPAFIDKMTRCINQHSVDVPARAGLVEALNGVFINRLFKQFEGIEQRVTAKHGFARRLFDIMLRRTLEEVYQISFYHSHLVAALSISLTSTGRIFETFPYSGAMPVTSKVLQKPVDTYYWKHYGYPYPHQDLIRLRLELRGTSQEAVFDYQLEVDAEDMTVIDGGLPPQAQSLPVLVALNDLIDTEALSGLTLVILDPANIEPIPDPVRRYIEDHDLLEAVINLPTLNAAGSRGAFTAWLLNSQKTNAGETLFIDTVPLAKESCFETIWFAAAVVQRWRSSVHKISSNLFKQLHYGELKGFFLKHLGDTYTDIPGVCFGASSQQVLNTPVSALLAFLRAQRVPPTFSLDNRCLLLELKPERLPNCSYIIGNNGAGKSMMLGSLAIELDRSGRRSVGVGFNLTDRFPIEPDATSNFVYQGMRAFAKHEDFLESICAKLGRIRQCSTRLNTFKSGLEWLGFACHAYVLHAPKAGEEVPYWKHLSAPIDIESESFPADTTGYAPLIAREDKDGFVQFGALSSGEQQVFSLLTSICAHAEQQTVFLIDEPEISLHVRWQQQLPSLLSMLAKQFHCWFVSATHAPIIVANATDNISHCFLAKDQQLNSIAVHQRHSVEAILLDGFETSSPDNSEINERCAVLVSRAIRAINQPGRPDPALETALDDSLKKLARIVGESQKNPDRLEQDEQLIRHARDAIKELFKRASPGVSQ
ncbi:ATP-binding protein [Pseudomonas silvicola]|nr:ATP-binding protein [Pseudomonas silvicola]